MRTSTAMAIGVMNAMLLAASACGGSSAAPATRQTPTPQATPAPQPTAQTVPRIVPGALATEDVTPVDFERLVALVPELPGWTRTQPRGQQVSAGVPISQANAEYTKGDSAIKLEIADSSFNPLILGPLSMMLVRTYSERTADGYKQFAAIGGSPGFESWLNESREAEVTVVVANRFIITASGDNVDTLEPVRSLVKAIDLGKLATLK